MTKFLHTVYCSNSFMDTPYYTIFEVFDMIALLFDVLHCSRCMLISRNDYNWIFVSTEVYDNCIHFMRSCPCISWRYNLSTFLTCFCRFTYCPTPDDFMNNETLMFRLVPFLVRDLVVVFAIAEPARDWVITDIQGLLRTYHCESDGFELQVRSVFSERVGQPAVYPRHYIDILIDELRGE